MTTAANVASPKKKAVYAPWDGRLVGETPEHFHVIMQTHLALEGWFRPLGDAFVGVNMFVYFEEGNWRSRVAPTLFVVRDTGAHYRNVWLTWEEGKPPQFVLEVTSRSTQYPDQAKKPGIYRSLGVEEYFRFDPLGEYDPVLRGLRLVNGEYELVAPGGDPPGLHSEVLGLDLCVVDGTLRLHRSMGGKLLPTTDELLDARLEAEARAGEERAGRLEEKARADEAEARVRELEARLRSRSD